MNAQAAQAGFALRGHNPDVLSCIANLSNDEVFTSPALANQMLDTLATAWADANDGTSIWADPTVTFLDPFTKSGVFLREIASRLTVGLAEEIPNLDERVDHILAKQIFGIGITTLTSLLARRSLYCSKSATGTHSIARSFDRDWGNIWFERTEHTWAGERCAYCGAAKSTYARSEELDSHAYEFIHTTNVKVRMNQIFGADMHFDVIIGNPPYQLGSDGGTRDVPIYQLFVEQAKLLEPRFLSVVIPSRWMASGLGLGDFRRSMLTDKRMRTLVDFPSAMDVFPGVEVKAGVCYFLWDAHWQGTCAVTTIRGEDVVGPSQRDLGEFDVFVRDERAVSILKKVQATNPRSINSLLARDKEFGWTSNFGGFHESEQPGDVPIYYIRTMKRSVGYIARSDIKKSAHLTDKWKVLVPEAYNGGDGMPHPILGKSLIAPSPSVCTQSYLFFYVDSEAEALSIRSYYVTRLFRFLVSLRKITQHATHSTYAWVPALSWDTNWTDEMLYARYGLTDDEIDFISSRVRPMELGTLVE